MTASKHFPFYFLVILCMATSFCPETEKQALLTFKKSLNHPSDPLSSWNIDVDCCEWDRVVCSNSSGHVDQLHLQSLHGKVNLSSLIHLEHLRYLDLSRNVFEGGTVAHSMGNFSRLLHILILEDSDLNLDSLDWLSRFVELKRLNMNSVNLEKAVDWLHVVNGLPSLVELHLSGCKLRVPTRLPRVNVTSLSFLNLSRNEFDSSSVARWVFGQSNLLYLDLSRNSMEGSVPAGSNTSKLRYVDLSWNKLSSNIPDWLYSCKDLEFLYLGYNSFQGVISENIANLSSIHTLSLRNNYLSGQIPSSITNLCRLRRLDLSRNELQGQISDSFGSMSDCFLESLALLRLRENQLSGPIIDRFGEFKSLTFLDLTRNLLSGAIPKGLGKLQHLNTLWLGFNKLSGEFPSSLGQLSNLKTFVIGRNMLEGVVNESHFSNLTKLKYFFASGNRMSLNVSPNWVPPFELEEIGLGSWDFGPRKGVIPSWIERQKGRISVLDLSDTGLSGEVPSWLCDVSVLNLSHNKLRGSVQDFKPREDIHAFPYYRWMYLGANNFSGPLPRVSNDTVELDLSNNSFSGTLSRFLCDYTINGSATNALRILNLAENQLTQEMPDCWMKWPYLKYLNLGNNNMFGGVPDSVGHLRNLLSLNLYGNRFSGWIPLSLQKCSKLTKIDLGGNDFIGSIPPWIGTSLSELSVLMLHSNKFSGNIPPTLCHLNALRILDLSNNNFSGVIPDCVSNFTAMASGVILEGYEKTEIEYSLQFDAFIESVSVVTKGLALRYTTIILLVTNINLSNNYLSGGIPDNLTTLTELKSLNLSGNHLTGSIPRGMGSMRQLESLDLSRNSLTGEIPSSVSGMSFLSHLNLSCNRLTGEVPMSTQLQSMDASSFARNDLCGAPLPRNCSSGAVEEEEEEEEEDEGGDESETDWFLVMVFSGYAVGISAVCTALVLNKSWREAYFGLLEKVWVKFYVYFKYPG